MEEVVLVKKAIKGNREAFENLIDIYFDRLCREAKFIPRDVINSDNNLKFVK